MGRKNKRPKAREMFAVDRDKTDLWIKSRETGIERVVAAADALPMTYFGDGGSTPYMKVRDVIAWHERELAASNGRRGFQQIADALKVALAKFESGEFR